jgi:hypothetical protein
MTKEDAAILIVEMCSDVRACGYDKAEYHEATALAIAALLNPILDIVSKETYEDDAAITETQYMIDPGIYDCEEIHHHCTVQILKNSETGNVSIGWWKEESEEQDDEI